MHNFILRWSFLLLIFCVSLRATAQAPAQGPYRLSYDRDPAVVAVAAGAVLAGYTIGQNVDELPLGELTLPQVPGFDRTALGSDADAALRASDIVGYGTVLLPGLLLLDRSARADALTVGVMFAETMLLNHGLTDIVKKSVLRPRPYLYDSALTSDYRVDAYDRSSYFSAHASNTAAAAFFLGRVFADYHPDSPLKPVVWTVSATLPALSGYLRVRAGQHFPTDVITGYAFGAAIGYAVPALHRRSRVAKGLTVRPLGNGIYLSYNLSR